MSIRDGVARETIRLDLPRVRGSIEVGQERIDVVQPLRFSAGGSEQLTAAGDALGKLRMVLGDMDFFRRTGGAILGAAKPKTPAQEIDGP